MSAGPASVLVISRNTTTARDLASYFEQCGVRTVVSDRFDPADGSRRITAVVVFPDEFPAQSAAVGVVALARQFSNSTLVIVTRDVERFEDVAVRGRAGRRGPWFVLPRPTWGWVLLDRVLQRSPPPEQAGDPPDETEEQ
jgi:hypothetical protein